VLAITPDFLDTLLARLSGAGWRFVSVGEMLEGPPDPRRIAITLDDGYRNNATHAAPVFRRHAAPFTIYVCAGFSDRTAAMWWDALEKVIARADAIPAPTGGGSLAARAAQEKLAAFHRWRDWILESPSEADAQGAVVALCRAHCVDLAALAAELVMDWDEVRAIAADPLCTIGAHTLTHPVLARLPEAEAVREMAASADRIEAETGTRPTSIAFPYGFRGAVGTREALLAERAGFASSMTTVPGYVPAGARHGLRRISVNGLFQSTGTYENLLSSGLWQLRDRIRPPR